MSNSMTPERAIKSIQEHNRIHFEKEKPNCPIITGALQMAISALEYRIPKKPEQGTTNAFIYACPTCGGPVGSIEVEEIWCDFCPKCGQAIDKALDWSDEL